MLASIPAALSISSFNVNVVAVVVAVAARTAAQQRAATAPSELAGPPQVISLNERRLTDHVADLPDDDRPLPTVHA